MLREEGARLIKLLDELSEEDPVDQIKLDETEAEFDVCQAGTIKKESEQAVTTGANSGTTVAPLRKQNPGTAVPTQKGFC